MDEADKYFELVHFFIIGIYLINQINNRIYKT